LLHHKQKSALSQAHILYVQMFFALPMSAVAKSISQSPVPWRGIYTKGVWSPPKYP